MDHSGHFVDIQHKYQACYLPLNVHAFFLASKGL
jgi:hypothetical protein